MYPIELKIHQGATLLYWLTYFFITTAPNIASSTERNTVGSNLLQNCAVKSESIGKWIYAVSQHGLDTGLLMRMLMRKIYSTGLSLFTHTNEYLPMIPAQELYCMYVTFPHVFVP